METLKLGTRRSLLAWAQSSWVAREIEKLNPGVRVELEGIDTRGDKIVDVSLRNVVGKEFFVAELDDALSSGRVDFTVHSMKDLSLERPEKFVLGAIPRRANPRDVILFGPQVMDKLGRGDAIRIGTSSPRRLENIPGFLAQALPRVAGAAAPRAELVEIRGNVNTRLSRVHEPAGSERALDGVVLAFAGLIRLWADPQGREELTRLLRGVRWMVLPLRECPAAPAQGALAVECRVDDPRVRGYLSKLHDAETESRVRRERQLLADWGGGCHQKFGATAVRARELGEVMYVRGRKPDDAYVEELRWSAPAALATQGPSWDGMAYRSANVAESKAEKAPALGDGPLFVAHWRALPESAAVGASRVWVSGTPSWFKLAARGIWVEGCAESLGFDFVEATLGEGVLQLPAFGAPWTVLTHDQAGDSWKDARVIATYQVPRKVADDEGRSPEGLAQAWHVYWGSGSQFDLLGKHALASARHYCGPGKTAAHLRSRGIEPVVFPSSEEWKKWLNRN